MKIPGTAEGLEPISRMIAEGRSINVTLIFSVDRYLEVAEAYISGLERAQGDLSRVSSVALVLRFEDRHRSGPPPRRHRLRRGAGVEGPHRHRLRQGGVLTFPAAPRGTALGGSGRAGRATPETAVGQHVDQEPGVPGHALCGRPDRPRHGEHPSRTPRWEAFEDHGSGRVHPHRRTRRGRRGAREARVRRRGSPLSVTAQLEEEGVAAFTKSFDELLEVLVDKADSLRPASRR